MITMVNEKDIIENAAIVIREKILLIKSLEVLIQAYRQAVALSCVYCKHFNELKCDRNISRIRGNCVEFSVCDSKIIEEYRSGRQW